MGINEDVKVLATESCVTLFALYKPHLSQTWIYLFFKCMPRTADTLSVEPVLLFFKVNFFIALFYSSNTI